MIRFRLHPINVRFRPFAAVSDETPPLSVKWNIMRIRGLHRIEIPVRNDSENIVTNVRVSVTVPDSLDFKEGTSETVRLGIIKPGEVISAIYHLKPRANVEAPLMGTLLYVDYRGKERSIEISPVKHYFDVDISSVEVEPRITPTEVSHVVVNVGDKVESKPTYGEGAVHIDRSVKAAQEETRCQSCGEPVKRAWRFCPSCQAQLKPAEARRT